MTQRGAIVTTWGALRPNVAFDKGMEVFGNALAWFDELAKEGRITGYRVYGGLNTGRGMIIAEGEVSELSRILAEPRDVKLTTQARAVVEDVTTEICMGGSPDDIGSYVALVTDGLGEAGLT